MFNNVIKNVANHIRLKKHPYIVIALMLLITGGVFSFNTMSAQNDSAASAAFGTQQLAAVQEYTPLSPLPGQRGVIVDTAGYLQKIIYLGIGIAIVLAVLMIVIGGVQYMASDAFTSKEDAKERMTMALWGLFIALGGYLLLYIINPQLVLFNLPSATEKEKRVNIVTKEPPPPIPTTQQDPNLTQKIEEKTFPDRKIIFVEYLNFNTPNFQGGIRDARGRCKKASGYFNNTVDRTTTPNRQVLICTTDKPAK